MVLENHKKKKMKSVVLNFHSLDTDNMVLIRKSTVHGFHRFEQWANWFYWLPLERFVGNFRGQEKFKVLGWDFYPTF